MIYKAKLTPKHRRIWIKYKHSFSHGLSPRDGWLYETTIVPCRCKKKVFTEHINALKESIENEYSWSEHYHGIEYSIVRNPPIKTLEGCINSLIYSANSKLLLVKEYKELVKKLKNKKH